MRFAFIESEKSLIEKIDSIINSINSRKVISLASAKLNNEIKKILLNTKELIAATQEKYKDLSSNKNRAAFTEAWKNVTALQDSLTEKVNAIHDGMIAIQNKVKPMNSRTETLSEFIADLSAERDQGKSQAALLTKIQADVIANAAMAMLGLQPSDLTEDDSTRRRECVTQAINTEVTMLEEIGDEDVLAMWRNQEAAFYAFVEEFLELQNQIVTTKQLEKDTTAAWKQFDKVGKQHDYEEELEDDRLSELSEIISKTVENLTKLQKTAKAPVNDFGLQALMNEIASGQEAFYGKFVAVSHKRRDAVNIVYRFADETPPESPKSTTSQSSSSFFSSASSRSSRSTSSSSSCSSSSSGSSSSNDSSETDEDEPVRKCARTF